jgi:D-3-phosphoglycerate dehydrogenase / 2-oxoglutarate reductase
MKNMSYRVLVADTLAEEGLAILREVPEFEVDVQVGLSVPELAEAVKGADGMVIRSGAKVTAEVLENADRLQVVGRAGVGLDNVDIEAATRKGVVVMNTPGGNSRSTAEHSFAMLFALARHVPQATASMKAGKWEKKSFKGIELSGKTLGIVGLGMVGSEMLKLARGANMNVLAYDPYTPAERIKELGGEAAELEDLLKRSDAITIHAPLTDATRDIIGEKELAMMKQGALLVNCARGGIVNEEALLGALNSGHLTGAALDAFVTEPPGASELVVHPKVITTPHLGASTMEAQVSVAVVVSEQVRDTLLGKEVRNAVNTPRIDPTQMAALRPYVALAEKLGSFAVQMIDGPPTTIEISCDGEIADLDTRPLEVAVLKGALTLAYKDSVNFVNAAFLAKEKGIKKVVKRGSVQSGYTSLLTVSMTSSTDDITLRGSVFGEDILRVVGIEGCRMEVNPSGNIIVVRNTDSPGVIGKVGHVLGKAGINISDMRLGLRRSNGDAVCALSCDERPGAEVEKALSEIEEVQRVKVVVL